VQGAKSSSAHFLYHGERFEKGANSMSIKVKDDLKELARHLSSRATYSDAMYELYVRMKVAQGRDDAERNRVQPHVQIKKHFLR
jgi:hypothetical protein